jgi:hypothetical protein
MEQDFTPVFTGVRVTRSLVLCVGFVDRCLSFCPFSFDHCVFGSSSIYGYSSYIEIEKKHDLLQNWSKGNNFNKI